MKDYLYTKQHDLITPDGLIQKLTYINEIEVEAEVFIDNISSIFVGFALPEKMLQFNLKSSLAQLGLNSKALEFYLDKNRGNGFVRVRLFALDPVGLAVLNFLKVGMFIGKVFAADDRRRVTNFDYLKRMFYRFDRNGLPLLSFGHNGNKEELEFENINGRAIAYLSLKKGKKIYNENIFAVLPTLCQALEKNIPIRDILKLHQVWVPNAPMTVRPKELLLVSTPPLHIRTFFARVYDDLLPKGFHHTSANILEPTTTASGDIYEFFGDSDEEIKQVPLEFYTLEPHREYVFFDDRDQLKASLDVPETIFNVFKTSPEPTAARAATFIVKGSQINRMKSEDWILRNPIPPSFTEVYDRKKYLTLIESYIQDQPSYPFLQAIEDGHITSQGVLFTRYFPSPLLKTMLLSYYVRTMLKRIYFQYPSQSHGYYFSQEDRAMLNDLTLFGIPIYWADETTKTLLRYAQRPGKTSGMFVPLDRVEEFRKAVFFGIYGSNLIEGNFENELKTMLQGILALKEQSPHPQFNKDTPLALVTGGGPGAMEVGNRMAKELNILSCAHVVDFRRRDQAVINEQRQNPYVEAKMTYRLDQLVERQAVFFLDFPIFVMGGIGTDFEFSLEEVRHKVGVRQTSPIILFGKPDYWRKKITYRYKCNLETGTIKGSEWLSNTLFCIQTAEQGLKVFRSYFNGTLPIGKNYPIYEEGFVIVE